MLYTRIRHKILKIKGRIIYMNDILYQTLCHDKDLFLIDLHRSDNIPDALEYLEKEIYSAWKNKVKYCRVVCGIGEGILKGKTRDALKTNPLVADFRAGGSGGDFIIVF